jgi:hypothetical protein
MTAVPRRFKAHFRGTFSAADLTNRGAGLQQLIAKFGRGK